MKFLAALWFLAMCVAVCVSPLLAAFGVFAYVVVNLTIETWKELAG